MKKYSIVFFLIFFSGIAFGQIVNIPDANFKSYLVGNSAINTNSDSEIQMSEAAVYAGTIYLYNKNITDMTGIEAFTSVTEINCSRNQISTLNINSNVALTTLKCDQNLLAALDVSQNLNLEYLDFSNNYVTSIDLSNNTFLTNLYCYINQLSTLDVSNNINLSVLNCSENLYTSIDVSNNTLLTDLSCRKLSLTSLDLSNNLLLTRLNCYSNSLTTIDVSNNLALINLTCESNPLGSGSIDVSNNTLLETINVCWCGLSTLDISNNYKLRSLWIHMNPSLGTIDLSNNPDLTAISINYCGLTSLDLSNNVKITDLWCWNNSMKSLDVSMLTSLVKFDCGNNQLEHLDIRNGNNINMATWLLDLRGNPSLYCVNVDDPIYSASNWTDVDPQTSFSDACCGHLKVNMNSINISCTDSGVAEAVSWGGKLPYTYDWLGFPTETSSILKMDSIGVYTVTVTDDSSCSQTLGSLIDGPGSKPGFDLDVHMSSGPFRPGNSSDINLYAFNDGCTLVSGKITLTFSGPAKYVNSSVAPNSVIGNILTWNFSNWEYASPHFLSDLIFDVDSTANIGDRICFDLVISPITGDEDATNNTKVYCFDVVNSWDPNNKQVYPQGVCDSNFTEIGKPLTYTINFQNKGTADAIDVFVLDTLDNYLDPKSLRVLSTSHEILNTEILRNNIIKFRFDNINLPDSASNEEFSQGYIIYEVNTKNYIEDGDSIKNSCAIYFDLNPPVVTNTTFNTMKSVLPIPSEIILDETVDNEYTLNNTTYKKTGIYHQYFYSTDGCDSVITINLNVINGVKNYQLEDFTLYPNPFSHYVDVQLEQYQNENIIITVFDVLGQQQFVNIENAGNVKRIDGTRLEKGIYFVQISDENGVVGRAKVIKN